MKQPGTPIAGQIFKPSTLEYQAEIVAISPWRLVKLL